MRYIVCIPDLYNLKTRKKLKIYVIVRIKFSINENTQRPEKKTKNLKNFKKFNLLHISEITRTVY